jgi:hypothetical protein
MKSKIDKSVDHRKHSITERIIPLIVASLILLQLISFQSVSADVGRQAKFRVVKAANGSALCPVSKPSKVVSARSKIQCGVACLVEGPSCTHVNYRQNAQLCEMFTSLCQIPPFAYQEQPGSVLLQVGSVSVEGQPLLNHSYAVA